MTTDAEIAGLLDRFKNKLSDAEQRKFTFVLAGRAGVGKSSTINTLMGQTVAKVGHFEATTAAVKVYESSINGLHFRLVDTPGLCDIESDDHHQDEYYLDLIRWEVPSVDCVWYVTQLNDTRVRLDELRAIRLICQSLGKDVWRNAVIVFTFADMVSAKDFCETLETRTELIRRAIGKHVEAAIANQIPSIAVSNQSMQTPDGELWLGNLYLAVTQRISQSGFLPFFLATASRLVSAKQQNGDTYVIQAPNADTIMMMDMDPATANYIPLTEENKEKLVRQLDASVIPGLIIAGSAIGTVFGPVGTLVGGIVGATIGVTIWLMK